MSKTLLCCAQSLSHVQLFTTPWTVAPQAPLSMGSLRARCWSGLPCRPPGDLPNPGIKPRSPALQSDSLPSESPGKPMNTINTFYLTVSVRQKFSSYLAQSFWPEVSEEFAVIQRCALGLEDPFLRLLNSVVFAVNKRPQLLPVWASPPSYLSILTTQQLALPRKSKVEASMVYMAQPQKSYAISIIQY